MNCPYCGSDDLYFDPIMRNYICEDCDKLIESEELEDE
jgi:transcription initiation factor TFIIIB Brf1 subunit/transcription initiation factor TFIIB